MDFLALMFSVSILSIFEFQNRLLHAPEREDSSLYFPNKFRS